MEIEIKPDEIDKYVKDAIITSTVGKIIQSKVEEEMKHILERKWDNPIDVLIKGIVRETVKDLLDQPENKIIIEKEVQEAFTYEHVSYVVRGILDKLK